MSDPVIWRGLERLGVLAGGMFFGYLGYRLYLQGITEGKNQLTVSSRWGKLFFSGVGPGLFFMAFGAIVLVVALVTGGAFLERSGQLNVEKDAQYTSGGKKALPSIAELNNSVLKCAVENQRGTGEVNLKTSMNSKWMTREELKGGEPKDREVARFTSLQ